MPAASRTKIEIDSSPFRRSHIRAPRGRGSWAFATTPNPRIEDVQFSPSMSWGDAQVWARSWFRAQQAAGAIPADISHATLYAQP